MFPLYNILKVFFLKPFLTHSFLNKKKQKNEYLAFKENY
jgi:hypothetical protein